jgi:recyclin-1
MKEAAYASWSLHSSSSSGDWEMGKMWAEKREIFYAHSLPSKSSQNFLPDGVLDFGAMDEFMSLILDAIAEHGSRAVRVFPPASGVLVAFAEKLAGEVVSEYVTSLLTHARQLETGVYLRCVAAAFKESWKMVDAIMHAAEERPDEEVVSRTRAEDVVYQMFEVNMDEYLDEEVEALKSAFEGACKEWDQGVRFILYIVNLCY